VDDRQPSWIAVVGHGDDFPFGTRESVPT